jgi:hypothetical protein
MCAGAGADTECDCDCAGAQHAVLTTGGVPAASRVTDRAKAKARAAGNPVVENDPGGGTVESRERARRLPPTVTDRLEQVVAGMPQTQSDWDALVPRDPNGLQRMEARLAELEQRGRDLPDEIAKAYSKGRNAEWDRLDRHNRQYTWETRSKRGDAAGDKAADPLRAELQELIGERVRLKARIRAFSPAMGGAIEWPKDQESGRPMPTADLQRHLDGVLEVGTQVLAHARTEADRDPEIHAARERLAAHQRINDAYNARSDATWAAFRDKQITEDVYDRRSVLERADRDAAFTDAGLERYVPRKDRQTVARRESEILRELIGSARPIGNRSHDNVAELPETPGDRKARGARVDARERLQAAEKFFPDDWVEMSNERPISLTSSDRAYYADRGTAGGTLAMDAPASDKITYNGGFADYTEEITVHELGHRMEASVPGLRALEFTMVRRRSTNERGELEKAEKLSKLTGSSGYEDHEVAFPDEWKDAYAGKTYESRSVLRPDMVSWELFQVGLQDTFGRSTTRYDKGDEIQAFVVGAMLTLGRRR